MHGSREERRTMGNGEMETGERKNINGPGKKQKGKGEKEIMAMTSPRFKFWLLLVPC